MSNTRIILDRQSDLILTSPSIYTPTGIVASDIQDSSNATDVQSTLDSLGTSINSINTNISDNYTELSNAISTDISTEKSRAESVEDFLSIELSTEVSELSSEISTKIDNLVDGAPSILDTLYELAEAINNDASFATTVTLSYGELSTTISTEISVEKSRAESVEDFLSIELSSQISVEKSRAESVEDLLSIELSSEVSDLDSQITALPDVDNLTIEIDAENSIRLKDTVEAPNSGVRTFNGKLALGLSPASFDNLDLITKEYLSSEVSTEKSRAESVEDFLSIELSSQISIEKSRAESVEDFLSIELSSEVSELSADVSSKIDALVSGAPSILDTLYELAEAINNDASFATTVTLSYGDLSDAISIEVSTEKSRAESVESNLESNKLARDGSLDMTGNLNMNGNSIDNVKTPTFGTDGANKDYVDDGLILKLDLSGGQMTGNIAMAGNTISGALLTDPALDGQLDAQGNQITNLPTPTAGGDAANKKYVDDKIADVINDLDLSDIDSIADLAKTFYQKVEFAGDIDGMNKVFTPLFKLNVGSESIFLNGVLQSEGDDYTVASASGKINSIEFVSGNTPASGDKVRIYGITNVNATDYNNA